MPRVSVRKLFFYFLLIVTLFLLVINIHLQLDFDQSKTFFMWDFSYN